MKYLLIALILIAASSASFLLLHQKKMIEISASPEQIVFLNGDVAPQKPLPNPPETIKAVYSTGFSAGNSDTVNYLIKLAKDTELNAVVIDVKDYSGYVLYDIKLPDAEKYKAKDVRIPKINSLIKKFHDEGIYVIARISVFQDPVLAKARPDLAIKSKKTGGLWLDNKKLAWIDPAAKDAWDYNVAIAKDAASRGFDEINFDYIRFASDGSLSDMVFPFYNNQTPEADVIKDFFKYLRNSLPGIKISADLFGLTTVMNNDLGIGQLIENAYAYFDYVCPMVYPSHYATTFLGYKNPAQYPYEVVKYSIDAALKRINVKNASSTLIFSSKLRPWLQDFNLGAVYDAAMVRKEIQAVYDAASSTPKSLDGWMLWNPSNVYTKGALNNE